MKLMFNNQSSEKQFLLIRKLSCRSSGPCFVIRMEFGKKQQFLKPQISKQKSTWVCISNSESPEFLRLKKSPKLSIKPFRLQLESGLLSVGSSASVVPLAGSVSSSALYSPTVLRQIRYWNAAFRRFDRIYTRVLLESRRTKAQFSTRIRISIIWISIYGWLDA
jgi:hypothetical protein